MTDQKLYTPQKVAARIIAAREYLGLNQKEFAKETGISPQQMNDWEAGRARMSLQGALKIYERFGVDPNWFFLNKVDTLPHNMATALSSSPSAK